MRSGIHLPTNTQPDALNLGAVTIIDIITGTLNNDKLVTQGYVDDAIGSGGLYLGWYPTESALTTAHPTGVAGNFATVGATDTTWIWDTDTNAWIDSHNSNDLLWQRTGTLLTTKNAGDDVQLDGALTLVRTGVDNAFEQLLVQNGGQPGITAESTSGNNARFQVKGADGITWSFRKEGGFAYITEDPGNNNLVQFKSNEVVFNNDSHDTDFTINKLTSGVAFRYDAGLNDIYGDLIHVKQSTHNIFLSDGIDGFAPTGTQNIGIGSSALYALTTGSYNVAIGYNAGKAITTQNENVFIGRDSGTLNSTSRSGIGIGRFTIYQPMGDNNIGIGYACCQGGTGGGTARHNVAIGDLTLKDVTNGYENTAIGRFSGQTIATGIQNIAIGSGANMYGVSGSSNIIMGVNAGLYLDTGNYNIALGSHALPSSYADTIAQGGAGNNLSHNVAIGNNALVTLKLASYYNIALGRQSGENIATGTGNILLGRQAGRNITGNNNLVIGHAAGSTAGLGSSNVILGAYAGFYETGSNKLFIDSINRVNEADARIKSIIYGEINATRASQLFRINAKLEVAESAIFNYDYSDCDFTINKKTAGEAFRYDAGADTHDFQGSSIQLDTPSLSFLGGTFTALATGTVDNDTLVTKGYVDENGGGGGLEWEVITAGTTVMADGAGYLMDPAGGAVSIQTPAAPTVGMKFGFRALSLDNTLTILANGNRIEGSTDDLVINIDRSGGIMVYSGADKGWVIVTEIGIADGPHKLGEYSALVGYQVDDMVSYGGKVYVCIQAGLNQQPDLSPLYWSEYGGGGTVSEGLELLEATMYGGLV